MATCTKKWQREVGESTFDYACSLDAKHRGPVHLDEEHNDAYPDPKLRPPEAPLTAETDPEVSETQASDWLTTKEE